MQNEHGTQEIGKLLEKDKRQETVRRDIEVYEARGGVMGLCRRRYSQAGEPEYTVSNTMH